MIAADTSTLIAYFAGERGDDVEMADQALSDGVLVFPPVVVTEMLSAKGLDAALRKTIMAIQHLAPTDGYWQRAGTLRGKLVARRLKARLADTLIAQSCIDYNVPLITRDGDFGHFVRLGGLKLA